MTSKRRVPPKSAMPLSDDERGELKSRLPSLDKLTDDEKAKLATSLRTKRTESKLISSTRHPQISNAPPPGKPVSGMGGYTRPNRTPAAPLLIDWTFWRMQRFVKDWQAAALSIGVNPDSMRHHPQAWMTGDGRAVFTSASFSDAMQEQEFDKRYRLAETWATEHGDRVRHYNAKEIELVAFVRWLTTYELTVPAQLLISPLTEPPTAGAREPTASVLPPKSDFNSAAGAVPPPVKGANAPHVWRAEAQRVAERLHRKDKAAGLHDSITSLGQRVSEDFAARGIEGMRGPIRGTAIVREAIGGRFWKRPT